jgi:fatty acid desaturase
MTPPDRKPSSPNAAAPSTWWRRWEVPTVALALAVYAAWGALVYWHAHVPGVLLFVLGGYLVQLHSSLQHEAIHALRRLPKPLRWALVWAPLNLWLPFPLFHRSHSAHHVNFHLTHPEKDTESAYHSSSQWQAYGPLRRAICAADQTLAFRMAIGPWLRLADFLRAEIVRPLGGDFSHVAAWAAHLATVVALVWYVTGVAGMGLGEYVLCFVYPAMMLGALRSFAEHRWEDSPHERVAIVESNVFFGLLFLYNNLHHIHHRSPTMPWYELPGHFRRNRRAVLEANGNFYYRGYGEVARRYLLRPVFRPVHPQW